MWGFGFIGNTTGVIRREREEIEGLRAGIRTEEII
jgi:hypothetical protein